MNRKQRNRALRRKRLVREDELQPGIAAGLTQGVPAEEALAAFPVTAPAGVETLRHMASDELLGDSRVPRPHFVAKDAGTDTVLIVGDRAFRDVTRTFTNEQMGALRGGMLCLWCLEPQPHAFADEHLEGCFYVKLHGRHAMRERQILDVAMEFEGNVHLGPAKPLSEHLAEVELRTEKRRFIDKVIEGGQGRIPKEWLRDAVLFPEGPPQELA